MFCKTYVSRSTTQLLRQLANLETKLPKSHTVLFSIAPSPSLHAADLGDIVKAVSKYPRSIGCLSAPITLAETGGDSKSLSVPTVCSIAAFDARTATPFRSTIPGKEPTQVGRWHAFRKKDSAPSRLGLPGDSTGIDWESVWAKTDNEQSPSLIPELQDVQPQTVKSILYVSDSAPEGLSQYLDRFNRASKIGVIASSTPFVNGRPFTLFYDGHVHSTGAVGICFSHTTPQPEIWFPELQPITDVLTITGTEGNIVHSLDDLNPSRLILSSLEKSKEGSPKNVDAGIREDEYFLAVLRDEERYQMYKITAGDPSRGTISLQSDAAPEVGSRVKIYRKERSFDPSTKIQSDIEVHTVMAQTDSDVVSLPEETSMVVLDGVCAIPSENGFIVSRFNGMGCERPWKSTVSGGGARFILGKT